MYSTIADRKPTEKEVRDLEAAHKILFAVLALSNNTYVNLFKRYSPQWKKNPDYKNSREFKIVLKLGVQVAQKAQDWFKTQDYLEQYGKIPKAKVKYTDFLQPSKNVAILKQASEYVKDWKGSLSGEDESGIGVIPLIIWGVIAIVGAVSAAFIVSRLTVSTKDRVELLEATKNTCKELNLTPTECASVVTTTQQEQTKNYEGVTETVHEAASGLSNTLLFGLAIFLGFNFLTSKKSHQ